MLNAEAVVTSAPTSAEGARVLHRLSATRAIDPSGADQTWRRYTHAAGPWQRDAVTDPVLARAGQGCPIEPLRTLDAIHLGTAPLFSQDVLPGAVLSTDRRVRDNAQRLGLSLAPAA